MSSRLFMSAVKQNFHLTAYALLILLADVWPNRVRCFCELSCVQHKWRRERTLTSRKCPRPSAGGPCASLNPSCSWCPHRPLTQLAVTTRADLNLRVAIIGKRRPKKLGNGWPLVRFRMEYLVTPLILALSIDVAHHEALSKAMSGILGSGANA